MKKLFLALVLAFGLVVPAFGGYDICDTYLRPIPALEPGFGYLSGGAETWVYLYNSLDTATKVDSAYTDANGKYCMTPNKNGLYKVKVGTTWYKDYWMPLIDSGYVSAYPNKQKEMLYVINKAGSTLGIGTPVDWDTLGIAFIAFTADAVMRQSNFADTLSKQEKGWNSLIFVGKGTATTDTIQIWGTNNGGVASSLLPLIAGANKYTVSNYLWSGIDSIRYNEVGIDSGHVEIYPYSGVISGTAANTRRFAGVVYPDSILDNAIGTIVTYGVVPAKVTGTNTAPILPGMRLIEGTGVFVVGTLASDTASVAVAKVLEATAKADTINIILYGK